MSVYKFVVDNKKIGKLTYYAISKDIKAYIRSMRHQWKKMDKDINEINIHSIIGGLYGEFEYYAIECATDCEWIDDKYIETNVCGKELLKRLVNEDDLCINKNRHIFDKKKYNRDYSRNCAKYTRPPPKTIGALGEWILEQQRKNYGLSP